MKLRHPFEWIKKKCVLRVFFVGLILTLLVGAGMQILGRPLITEAAPAGIVSFEFAGDVETAQSILASWRHEVRVIAGLNLGVDYLFMLAYGVTIGLGCILVARGWHETIPALALIGTLFSWGSIGAAFLDAIENYALIRILVGSLNETWPVVSQWCAGVKFFLVGIGLVYVVGGGLVLFIKQKTK